MQFIDISIFLHLYLFFLSRENETSLITYVVYAVYHDGTLCMDIIQDAWSPCHNVSTILTSIQVIFKSHNSFTYLPVIIHEGNAGLVIYKLLQSLLTDPNPASPANNEAAHMYQHDIQAYNKFVNILFGLFFIFFLFLNDFLSISIYLI